MGPFNILTALIVFLSLNFCQCDDQTAVKATTNVTSVNYRLPRSLSPETYKLQIFTHLNDEDGFKYYGDVRITVSIYFYFNFDFYFPRKIV